MRTNTGIVYKGHLPWRIVPESPTDLPPLPAALTFRDQHTGEYSQFDLSELKAVFFVRSGAGDAAYEEMKFFRERTPSALWVQMELLDGEVLEGRTANCARLLLDAGLWLWPTDSSANNRLVYVPRTSMLGFRVTGLASSKSEAESD